MRAFLHSTKLPMRTSSPTTLMGRSVAYGPIVQRLPTIEAIRRLDVTCVPAPMTLSSMMQSPAMTASSPTTLPPVMHAPRRTMTPRPSRTVASTRAPSSTSAPCLACSAPLSLSARVCMAG